MAQSREAELIERSKGGDKSAFGLLIRMHQRRVHHCAIHMLGDRGEAEDAVQETFIRAWRAIERFDGRAELSTWLYRICINVCLNALRRRRRGEIDDIADPRIIEPAADPTQGLTDPDHVSHIRELQNALTHALSRLSPSLRATVILVLIDGVPQKEASEILGCSEGTVAWRVHEARRKMRQELDAYFGASRGKNNDARWDGGAERGGRA